MTSTVPNLRTACSAERRYVKKAIPAASRRAVASAAGGVPGRSVDVRCHYCPAIGSISWPLTDAGLPSWWVSIRDLEIDHVHPEYHGGSSDPDNLVLACRSCNRRKGAKA